MVRIKKWSAGLLAAVMLLSALPTQVIATEAEESHACALKAVKAVAPACRKEGKASHYACEDCGMLYWDAEGDAPVEAEELVMPKLGCKVEKVEAIAATCEAKGRVEYYRCTVCGKRYLEPEAITPRYMAELETPKTGCSVKAVKAVAAACRKDGTKAHYACEHCGKQFLDAEGKIPAEAGTLVIPKLGCKVEKVEAIAATCETKGRVEYYRCTVCGKRYLEPEAITPRYMAELETPKTGCSVKAVKAVAATCRKDGMAAHYACEDCGKLYQDAQGKTPVTEEKLKTPKLGCKVEKVEAKEATCETKGCVEYYRCTVCGKRYLEPEAITPRYMSELETPKAKCTVIAIEAVAPSCSQTGFPAHYLCTACGKLYLDKAGNKPLTDPESLILEKLPHIFGDWEVVKPAGAGTKGKKQRVCEQCDTIETATIPALTRDLEASKLTVKLDSETQRPALSWTAVSGAKTYRVYRTRTDIADAKRELVETVAQRTFLDTTAVPGVSYNYTIMAINDTSYGKFSNKVACMAKCLKPKISVTIDAATGRPLVSWGKVEGAVEYQVYRSTSSTSGYKLAKTTKKTSVLFSGDEVGSKYYYKVKAICANDAASSGYSTVVDKRCRCPQPVVKTAYGENGGIIISWEKTEGAKKYQVYRSSTKNGEYTKLDTVTSTSYTDTKAPKDKRSWYMVKAYGSDTKTLSEFSKPCSLINHTFGSWKTTKATSPEADGLRKRTCSGCGQVQQQVIPQLVPGLDTPVVTITSQVQSGKPTLSWKAVPGATRYRIYRLNQDTGVYSYYAKTESCTYTYTSTSLGTKYSFRVVAVNETQCSARSSVVSATARCTMPQVKITMDPKTYAQTLSWEAVKGAVRYNVYQSTSPDADFKLLVTTTELTATFAESVPGVPVYYKIRAIHEKSSVNSILSPAVSLDGETTQLVIHAGWATDTCNKITWGKIKNAKTYNVYRADSLDGSYSKIATVKGTEHVDLYPEDGLTHSYMVKAYNEDGKLLSTSQKEAADKPCRVPLKIYVSPSSQPENKYAYGGTNEAKECRKIALVLVESLKRCGFSAMTNVNESDDMYVRVPESNAWGANLHVPIHSNAFNKSAMGTQVYHDGVYRSNSRKAARNIYDELAPLTPGTSGETIKQHSGLYEFNKCNNPTAYIEVAFHDTTTEAKWIINNTNKIAEAICKGICKTYGVPYIAP